MYFEMLVLVALLLLNSGLLVVWLSVRSHKSKLEADYKRQLEAAILKPEFVAGLRRELEQQMQDKFTTALKPIDTETKRFIEAVNKEAASSLKTSTESNRSLIEQSLQKYTQEIQALLKEDIASLQAGVSNAQNSLNGIERDYKTALDQQRQVLVARAQTLARDQLADLLVEYLHASVAGLEIGDQQEFILSKLEENKQTLLQELAQ